MKRSTKRKIRDKVRRFSRWYRKKLSVILSVVVTLLVISLAALIFYNSLDDFMLDEDAPVTTAPVSTTTTTIHKLPRPAVVEDMDFNYISYSSISGYIFSMNTERLYNWCAERDFTSIRGDVRITKDNKLIMHFAESFQFAKNGKLTRSQGEYSTPVRELTEAECLALRYDATESPVCTFADYLTICKSNGKIAFVSIAGEDYIDTVPVLLATLEAQEMLDRCIINSPSYAALEAVRAADATVALSYQQNYQDKLQTKTIDAAVKLENCIVLGTTFEANYDADEAGAESLLDMSVIEYAKERGILIYESQVFSTALVKELKELGIDGVQMPVAPVIT